MIERALQLSRESRFSEARAWLRPLCGERPSDAQAWLLLGACEHALGDLQAALAAFDTCLRLAPEHLEAMSARGAVLLGLGRDSDALAAYRAALAIRPGDPRLLTNAGVVLQKAGDWQGALEQYEAALRSDPHFVPALMNHGVALARLGRATEALASAERLAAAAPDRAETHFNHAEMLLALDRYEEALAAAARALAIDGAHAGALFHRGLALACLARFEEADEAFGASRVRDPARFAALSRSGGMAGLDGTRVDPRAVYLLRLAAQQETCDWRRREELSARLQSLVHEGRRQAREVEAPDLLYKALGLPVDEQARLALARGIANGVSRRVRALGALTPHAPLQRSRIRVGYLSPDFREHLNAYLTLPLFRLHDRARFEIYAYSLAADDGSAARARIAQRADRFVDLTSHGALAAAERIEADGIEVLVDLGGYTLGSRPEIVALHPAAVQVSYLGFPATLGADYVDYRIGDNVSTPPEAAAAWTERLIALPGTSYLYDAHLYEAADRPESVPVERGDYGLPEDAFVFCALHQGYKIEPGIFDVWMDLLRTVPNSVLWLRGQGEALAENLRREARQRDVDGERLIFAPFEERGRYLARYRVGDLFLDTHLFNAMTTACDALLAGLPVITCAGSSFTSRVSASLLTAAGFPELIARDLSAYRRLAIDLAGDRDALAALRTRVERDAPRSALFDAPARVRELEAAYVEMVRRHRAGLAPEPFAVQATRPRYAWF
jgi:protein O-GlcNAc transferase